VAGLRYRVDATTGGLVLTVLAICAIQMALPGTVTIGPTDFLPFVELAGIPIVAVLMVVAPEREAFIRGAMNFFLALLVAATVMNALLLLWSLLSGTNESGVVLLFSGFGVLIINVLSFGLVYWWLDARNAGHDEERDSGRRELLYPQEGLDEHPHWQPSLMDYLYTAYTNIIAFSPTDTMPLSHRMKGLFTVQSATALLTIVVTLSRAINLIPGGAS